MLDLLNENLPSPVVVVKCADLLAVLKKGLGNVPRQYRGVPK
jgi:hypothetical protein